MPRRNRETLRNLFRKGSIPTEANFADMIDSVVNIVDDGFHKSIEDGLKLSPTGDSDKLVTFYRSSEHSNVAWTFELGPNKDIAGFNMRDPGGSSRFFIHPDGGVGIGTSKPVADLDVQGVMGCSGRVGTHAMGTVPADGKWHNIIENMNGCNGFEVVARVGKKESGRYALLHATVLSTFGRSHSKIRKTQAYYGWFWNKMALRFTGTTFDYNLQIKTRSGYGKGIDIQYHITRIWSDEGYDKLFAPKEYT